MVQSGGFIKKVHRPQFSLVLFDSGTNFTNYATYTYSSLSAHRKRALKSNGSGQDLRCP